jgi:hypothetical protein
MALAFARIQERPCCAQNGRDARTSVGKHDVAHDQAISCNPARAIILKM